MLLDWFAIATELGVWRDFLLAIFDVTAWYWNLLWGGFIIIGGAVFVLECILLKKNHTNNNSGDESEYKILYINKLEKNN